MQKPFTELSPQTGVLHSSEALGWRGIVVEQRYHSGGEYTFSYPSFHLIGLHQDRPMPVEQVRTGRSLKGIMTRGNVQIVPAGTENIWHHQEGSYHMHVLLAPEVFQHVAEENNQHQRTELLDLNRSQDPRIEHISTALLTEVLEGGISGRLYVEGLTTALAAHLLRAYTSPQSSLPETTRGLPEPLLRKVMSMIEERLAEDLSLVELASEVGLSPSYFSRLFRQTMGLTPHQYLVQCRVERAHSFLTSTRLSIAEIATAVGFYDQSHLVRQMQRVKGAPPTSIRNRLSWVRT